MRETRKTTHLSLLLVSFLVCLIGVYINFIDVIERKTGGTLAASQIPWFSDSIATAYSFTLGVYYLVLMYVLRKNFYSQKGRTTIITAIVIFASFTLQLIFENMYIYHSYFNYTLPFSL